MRKTNFCLKFIKPYINIFFKVFLFKLFFSIKFKYFFNNIVMHKNKHLKKYSYMCLLFLIKILKFIKKEKIKLIIDKDLKLGNIIYYVYRQNKIKCYGI